MENQINITHSAESFTKDFHKTIAAKSVGNFVSSALSAHVVLAMTACGAEGNTALEMNQVLKLPKCDSQVYQGFQSFIDNINSVTNVILKMANKIYVSHTLSVQEKFKEITGTYFRSESETIDFSNSAKAAQSINQWCAKNTNDKVLKIVEKDALSSDSAMILLNALYFKGSWKNKFDSCNTQDRPFHVSKTEVKQVPTMYTEKKFHYRYFEDIDAECVVLPYENEDLYMMIFVPKEVDGVERLEKNLEKLEFDYDELRYTEKVQLYLPKFKVETEINLKDHLQELGMKDAFSTRANFKGIVDGVPVAIDEVIQKAFIEVNEEGAEAAAVTGVCIVKRSLPLPPIELHVDRPFLYKIFNGEQKVTLFSGRVANPSS